MKMRPQVNGPIDVGFGNYILTAPADRTGREHKGQGTFHPEDGGRKTARESRVLGDGKIDVSELMADSNTLTNPYSKRKKTEL